MTSGERDRLSVVETKIDLILEQHREFRQALAATNTEIASIKTNMAKAGGAMIAVGTISAAVTWALTNLKTWVGLTGH